MMRLLSLRRLVAAVLAGLVSLAVSDQVMAVSNSFVAVLNNATSNADSRQSVTYYDANNIGGGPLFSVFLGFEINGPSSNAYDDPSAISVDPSTGDLYVISFDSGTVAGVVDINAPASAGGDPGAPLVDVPSDDDTTGDWDVYRINFQTVLSHYTANMEGHDLRNVSDPAPNVGGPAPTITVGSTATELLDYVTYGSPTPYVEERMLDPNHLSPEGVFDQTHSNTFVLTGALEKVGEIDRNRVSSAPFHVPSLSFIADGKLLMIDQERQDRSSPHALANDNDFRMIERVSTSPGAATSNGVNGGYNNTTTESWQSRRIAQVNLDSDDPGSFLSEPIGTAYYDNGSGVRGVWVVDRDEDFVGAGNPVPDVDSGDDIAFLQLDGSYNSLGYRPFTLAGNPTKFEMEHDPAVPGFAGRVGNVFVDEDSGDLIVVEEGYTDNPTFGGPGFHEPAVIRMTGINYDSAGNIALGTWGPRMLLTPTKDTGDTFVERGYWTAYDSATDKVYFAAPGGGMETPTFEMDIFVLDLATGLTSSFNNTDNSVSLFLGNEFNGDKVVAFTLAEQGLDGDYNDDGIVDAADYVVFQKFLGQTSGLPNDPNAGTIIDVDQYNTWAQNYGQSSSGSGGTVPEPTSITMLAIGLAALAFRRRSA